MMCGGDGRGSHPTRGWETILRIVQLVQLATSLLVVTRPSFAGSLSKTEKREVLQVYTADVSPRFDAIIQDIEANIGETVLLPCTVRNMGDKVVSWMRRRDLSILTSGELTFSADSRFESVHTSVADFWGLRIRGVRISDAGQYECQVNTDPKMNLAVRLSIIDHSQSTTAANSDFTSRAHIKSPKEISTRPGSRLTLTCEITENDTIAAAGDDPLMERARVHWLHDAKEITSKFDEGGISVETDYRQGRISSRLIINLVQHQHAGNYTCRRYATKEDYIQLKVSDDEHIEAMQQDSAYVSSSLKIKPQIVICLLYLTMYIYKLTLYF